MPVKPIPDGASVLTPILIVTDADALLAVVRHVFDARDHQITRRPDGRILHADVTIGGAHLMLGEAEPGPHATGGVVNVYVTDTDETYARACAAGAVSMQPPVDRFYGDRNAVVRDPAGVVWSIATHVEDVAPDELKRREAEAIKEM